MSRWAFVLAVVASALAAAGCTSHERAGGQKSRLTDLTGVRQLQRDFDEHSGRPRLLLILSPT